MNRQYTTGKPYKRRSDGLWVVAIELGTGGDGKRKRVTIARKARHEAVRAAREKLSKIEQGVVGSGGRMTVEAWFDYWLDNIVSARELRPATLRTYRSQARTISSIIGAHRLEALTAAHVREVGLSLERAGKSIKTINLAQSVLTMALRDAVRDLMITRNPAEHVDLIAGTTDARPALKADQATALVNCAMTAQDPFATRWYAAVLFGARQGELLGLTWDRVDFDTGRIDLSWQLSRLDRIHGCAPRGEPPVCGMSRPLLCDQVRLDVPRGYVHQPLEGAFVLAPPKTEQSRRVLPMPPIFAATLRDHYENGPRGRHNLVWTNPKTAGPLLASTDSANWHEALQRAGLPKMPLHSARHTAATLLRDMGVGDDVRMQIMGHSSQVTHQKYVHLDQSHALAALTGLSSSFAVQPPAALLASTADGTAEIVDADVEPDAESEHDEDGPDEQVA